MLRGFLMWPLIVYLLIIAINASPPQHPDAYMCDERTDESTNAGLAYRGCQRHDAENQSLCLNWDKATSDKSTTALNADSGLGNHNYCRNPLSNKRSFIWCWTSSTVWHYCKPVFSVFKTTTSNENYLKLCNTGAPQRADGAHGWCQSIHFREAYDTSGNKEPSYHIYTRTGDDEYYLFLSGYSVPPRLIEVKNPTDAILNRQVFSSRWHFNKKPEANTFTMYTTQHGMAHRYFVRIDEDEVSVVNKGPGGHCDDAWCKIEIQKARPRYFNHDGVVMAENNDCIASWSACDKTCTQKYIVTRYPGGAGKQCETKNNKIRECSGGTCVNACNEVYNAEDKWKDYRGCQTKTVNGYTCQKWTSQSPHKHTETYLANPSDGIGDHNYCRNPSSKVQDDGAWCYTTSSDKPWDYCWPVTTPVWTMEKSNELYYLKMCTTEEGAIIRQKATGWCERITFQKGKSANSFYMYTRSESSNQYRYLAPGSKSSGDDSVVDKAPGKEGEFYLEEIDPMGVPPSYLVYLMDKGMRKYLTMYEDNAYVKFTMGTKDWKQMVMMRAKPVWVTPSPYKAIPIPGLTADLACKDNDALLSAYDLNYWDFPTANLIKPELINDCAGLVRAVWEQQISGGTFTCGDTVMLGNNAHVIRELCCASCAAMDVQKARNPKVPNGGWALMSYKGYCPWYGQDRFPNLCPNSQCGKSILTNKCSSGTASIKFYRGGDDQDYSLPVVQAGGACSSLSYYAEYECSGGDQYDVWDEQPEPRSNLRPATLIFAKTYVNSRIWRNYLYSDDASNNLQGSRISYALMKGGASGTDNGVGGDNHNHIEWKHQWYLEDKPNYVRGYVDGTLYVRNPDRGEDYVLQINKNEIPSAQRHTYIRDLNDKWIDETFKVVIEPKGTKLGRTYYHIYTTGKEETVSKCGDKKACKWRTYAVNQVNVEYNDNEDYKVPLTYKTLHYGKRNDKATKDELYDSDKQAAANKKDSSEESSEDEEDEDEDKSLISNLGEWYLQDISQFSCQCVGATDNNGNYGTCQLASDGKTKCFVLPEACELGREDNADNLEYQLSTQPCEETDTFYHERMGYDFYNTVGHYNDKTFKQCRKLCTDDSNCIAFVYRYFDMGVVDNGSLNCKKYTSSSNIGTDVHVNENEYWNAYYKIKSKALKLPKFDTTRMVDDQGFVTLKSEGWPQLWDTNTNRWLYIAPHLLNDDNNLEVICRTLGFGLSGARPFEQASQTTDVVFDHLMCLGTERRFEDCTLFTTGSGTYRTKIKCAETPKATCEAPQLSQEECFSIIDCAWSFPQGKCIQDQGKGAFPNASPKCDAKDVIKNVHVIFQTDTSNINTNSYRNPLLCLYEKERANDQEACSEIKPRFNDYGSSAGDFLGGASWFNMGWWNGMYICNLLGKVKIKVDWMDSMHVTQVVVVIEGKTNTYVAIDPTMGHLDRKLGVTTTQTAIDTSTSEYTWTLSKDFGRRPDIDVDDEIDYASAVWFAAQTAKASEYRSKSNPGFNVFAKAKFVDDQLYELSNSNMNPGYTSVWTVSAAAETNWKRMKISNLNMILIDHGNQHKGEEEWIFDKHMVIVKSQKGHYYVPALTAGKLKLEKNKDAGDLKSVPLKVKTGWYYVNGKVGFTSTMSDGYWSYVQRIDSNSPDFTYTRSVSKETSTENEETNNEIAIQEDFRHHGVKVEACIGWAWDVMNEATMSVDLCGSIRRDQFHSDYNEYDDSTGKANAIAVESLTECSISLACTGATITKLSDLDRVDATSDACYAWQWMTYQYDEFSKEMKYTETCSFVVIDKVYHTPQCQEGDCDDTTDCQKCLSGKTRQDSLCPFHISTEYTATSPSNIIKHFKNKAIVSTGECQAQCSKRIGCKTWTFYKEKTPDFAAKDCLLFNEIKPNQINKAMVTSGTNCYFSNADDLKKKELSLASGKSCPAEHLLKPVVAWDLRKCVNECKDVRDCRYLSYVKATQSCKLFTSCKKTEWVDLENAVLFTFDQKTTFDSMGQGCCSEPRKERQNGGKPMTKFECEELCLEKNACVAYQMDDVHATDAHGKCTLYLNTKTKTPVITLIHNAQCLNSMCYAARTEEELFCPLGYRQVGTTTSDNVMESQISDLANAKISDCRKLCENSFKCNAFTYQASTKMCKIGINPIPEGHSTTDEIRMCARLDLRDKGVFEVTDELTKSTSWISLNGQTCNGKAEQDGGPILDKERIDCFNECISKGDDCIAIVHNSLLKSCVLYTTNPNSFDIVTASDNGSDHENCWAKLDYHKASPCHIIRGAEISGTILEVIKEGIATSALCMNKCGISRECHGWDYDYNTGHCNLYSSKTSYFIYNPESDAGEPCFKVMSPAEKTTGVELVAEVAISATGEMEYLDANPARIQELLREANSEHFDENKANEMLKGKETEVGAKQSIVDNVLVEDNPIPWGMYFFFGAIGASIAIYVNHRSKKPESMPLLEKF